MSESAAVEKPARAKLKQYALLAVVAAASLGIMAYMMIAPMQKQRAAKASAPKPPVQRIEALAKVDAKDVWVARSTDDLAVLRADRETTRRELEAMRQELKLLRERPSAAPLGGPPNATGKSLAVTLPPPPAPRSGAGGAASFLPPPPGTVRTAAPGPGAVGPAANGILDVRIETPAPTLTDKSAAPCTVETCLPAGAFIKALVLGGIDAPTGGAASGNPRPMLLKLVDNGTLPNSFRSRVEACHVIAAAYGDLASERAYPRTETLSCVLKSGAIVEVPLAGYITGEDGKTGMRGTVVSKQGTMLAKSALAGFLGGIGSGISQSYTTVSQNPFGVVSSPDPNKIAEYGLAQGTASTLDRISKYYLDSLKEIYPIIETAAGREVEIVVTKGVRLELPAGELAAPAAAGAAIKDALRPVSSGAGAGPFSRVVLETKSGKTTP